MAEPTQDIAALIAEVKRARAGATAGPWKHGPESSGVSFQPEGENWCIRVEHNAMPRLLTYIRELEAHRCLPLIEPRKPFIPDSAVVPDDDEAPR
jgi:hypothetical protein